MSKVTASLDDVTVDERLGKCIILMVSFQRTDTSLSFAQEDHERERKNLGKILRGTRFQWVIFCANTSPLILSANVIITNKSLPFCYAWARFGSLFILVNFPPPGSSKKTMSFSYSFCNFFRKEGGFPEDDGKWQKRKRNPCCHHRPKKSSPSVTQAGSCLNNKFSNLFFLHSIELCWDKFLSHVRTAPEVATMWWRWADSVTPLNALFFRGLAREFMELKTVINVNWSNKCRRRARRAVKFRGRWGRGRKSGFEWCFVKAEITA